MTSGRHLEPAVAFTRSYFFRFVERHGRRFLVGPFCVACRRDIAAGVDDRCGCQQAARPWRARRRR